MTKIPQSMDGNGNENGNWIQIQPEKPNDINPSESRGIQARVTHECNQWDSCREYEKIRSSPGFRPHLSRCQQEMANFRIDEIEKRRSSWRSKIPFRCNGFKADCFLIFLFYMLICFVVLLIVSVLIQDDLPLPNNLDNGAFHPHPKIQGVWPTKLYKAMMMINQLFYTGQLSVKEFQEIHSSDETGLN